MSLRNIGRKHFVTKSALSAVLKEVEEMGLPDATSRQSIKRARDEQFILENAADSFDVRLPPNPVDTSFEGQGVLIVAKETLNDAEPLCLGLGKTKNKVRLFPCFREGVAATLAPTWETGAVIVEETMPHNRWEVGPCSSDGNIERLDSGELNVTRGIHSRTGPSCLLK